MPDALPGELHPVPFDPRRPLTWDEVVGVNRRLDARRGRGETAAGDVAETDATPTPVAFRLPRNMLARAKAKADTDGVPLSEELRIFLDGYGRAPMGTVPVWVRNDTAQILRMSGDGF